MRMNEGLFRMLAEKADRGLVIFDAKAEVIWSNTDAAAATFAAKAALADGRRESLVSEYKGIRYFDKALPVMGDDGEMLFVIVEEVEPDKVKSEYEQSLKVNGMGRIEASSATKRASLGDDELVAESPAMQRLKDDLDALSHQELSVILQGPAGSGKTAAIKYLASRGKRKNRPFVTLTPAQAEQQGAAEKAFSEAAGGIVFLDAPDDLSEKAQRAVLKASDAHRDVRITAATDKDLFAMAASGKFDIDLYVRIATKALRMPSIRERREDIDGLVRGFALRELTDGEIKELRNDAMRGISVAELRERVVGMTGKLETELQRIVSFNDDAKYDAVEPGKCTEEKTLPAAAGCDPKAPGAEAARDLDATSSMDAMTGWDGFSLAEYIDGVERRIISRALSEGGSTYKAAKLLGVNQSTVVRKKQKLGL